MNPGHPRSTCSFSTRYPRFTELCGRLTALGVPQTLRHDDINDGNAFLRDNRYVFFDWGEACVSHLFRTLVVTLRILAYTCKLQPGGAEIARLRCADLEPRPISRGRPARYNARSLGAGWSTTCSRRFAPSTLTRRPPAYGSSSSTALPHLGRRLVLTRPPNTAGPRWRVLRAAPRRRSTNRHTGVGPAAACLAPSEPGSLKARAMERFDVPLGAPAEVGTRVRGRADLTGP